MSAIPDARIFGAAGAEAPAGRARLAALLPWSALVPLSLLLHPYAGLLQDARIYLGRGIADRDPAGIGRDIMFAHDQQTGLSLMRLLVEPMLGLWGAGEAALILALLGALVWIVSVAALARRLAPGRVAWAAAVCIIVLPSHYGAFSVFNYAETIATPRVFASAAVLGGLAALIGRRPLLAGSLLLLAAAFHPLIALPGLAVALALLIRADRRWLVLAAGGIAGLTGAGLLGLPYADRLFQPVDGAWLSILRDRSTYLFPTLWPSASFGPILFQATAILAASAFATRRVADLLLATLIVAVLGLAAAWLVGDLCPSLLVVQVQPWRALWLLAVTGNASFALAAVALWRRGGLARLALALLVLTGLSADDLALAAGLALFTLLAVAALRRETALSLSRGTLLAVAGLTIGAAIVVGLSEVQVAVALLQAAQRDGAQRVWPMVVAIGLQTVPLVGGALVIAGRESDDGPRAVRVGAALAVAVGCLAAAWLWDARSPGQRVVESDGGDPALRRAIGPARGDLLWIDDDSQSWLVAGRPSFFSSVQGAPTLFSRDLAIEWAARGRRLLDLGLVRPEALAPWTTPGRDARQLPLRAESVAAFCADPRRPAALVAAGDQRAAVPAGLPASLWRSPKPMQRSVVDEAGIHWQTMTVFTVVRCAGAT